MSSASDPKALPVRRVADVKPRTEEQRWLVRSLWLRSAVGVVGGLPKCYKTWFAIELSWAVASGKKALGLFDVEASGPVLVFLAEDDPPDMRARFDAVAQARNTDLASLPISFIDVTSLLLDDPSQMKALRRTIDKQRPRLLVLDPFIRLVRRVDENSASEVSAVLGELRRLQRDSDVAIALVHHMRKARSAHPGQQLRGSGDFAAWCDSAIYITRRDTDRLVTVEHRSAPSPDPFRLQLIPKPHPHLELTQHQTQDTDPTERAARAAHSDEDPSLAKAVLELLRLDSPRSTVAIRSVLRVRKATLVETLNNLAQKNMILRNANGWALPESGPRQRELFPRSRS